jgi:hypothetical protein
MNCQFLIYGMLHTEFHSDKPVLGIRICIRNQMRIISHKSGSGFGSFHHQVKMVRKTLTFSVFLQLLYDFNIGRMM